MSRISGSRPSKRRVHAVELLEPRELLTSFTVTSTLDSGTGSLRQAIVNADAVSGPSTIDFSIPGPGVHDINLASVLPDITQPVTIDGTSEPGYAGSPLVEIFGGESVVPNQFSEKISGLPYVMEISGDGASVEGLTFNYVVGTALEIFGSSDTVQGDVFGTSVGTFTTGDPGEDHYLDNGVDRAS
jgi:hypothetical protein